MLQVFEIGVPGVLLQASDLLLLPYARRDVPRFEILNHPFLLVTATRFELFCDLLVERGVVVDAGHLERGRGVLSTGHLTAILASVLSCCVLAVADGGKRLQPRQQGLLLRQALLLRA